MGVVGAGAPVTVHDRVGRPSLSKANAVYRVMVATLTGPAGVPRPPSLTARTDTSFMVPLTQSGQESTCGYP